MSRGSRMTGVRASILSAMALLVSAGLLSGGAVPAQAYNTWHDRNLVYGVHNQHYWLDSSAEKSHPKAIPAGVKRWSDTKNTKVYYTRTSAKSLSRMDFYRRKSSSGTYCAITALYIDTKDVSSKVVQGKTDWVWGKVTIDPLLKNTSACGSSTHRAAIIAHEQGHVMGIAHNNNTKTLMYVGISGTNVSGPKGDDTNAINHLY